MVWLPAGASGKNVHFRGTFYLSQIYPDDIKRTDALDKYEE